MQSQKGPFLLVTSEFVSPDDIWLVLIPSLSSWGLGAGEYTYPKWNQLFGGKGIEGSNVKMTNESHVPFPSWSFRLWHFQKTPWGRPRIPWLGVTGGRGSYTVWHDYPGQVSAIQTSSGNHIVAPGWPRWSRLEWIALGGAKGKIVGKMAFPGTAYLLSTPIPLRTAWGK